MSMTENEALKRMKMCIGVSPSENIISSFKLMSDALDELQQYKAIGTVEELKKIEESFNAISDEVWYYILAGKELLERYEAIGTIEEFKDSKEKSVAKKPIEKVLPYSEEYGFNSEWKCPTCGAYVGYFSEGMSEPEQMEYCNECGQHIAKDWTET